MKKILLIRSDRLGEFILSLPAIKLVRENYPAAKLYLMATPDNLSLVRHAPFLDGVLTYRKSYGGYLGALRLAGLFQRHGFDCVVALNPRKEFHLAAWLAGVKVRVGYDRKWGGCLTHKIPDEKTSSDRHETEHNVELVGLICPRSFMPTVELVGEAVPLPEAVDCREKYIVLHPFTSNPQKLIGDDFWPAFCAKAAAVLRRPVVIIGTAAEQAAAQKLAKSCNAQNLCGVFTLPQLKEFLQNHCRLFVGLDSGPMHLAALVGTPTVGMFKISSTRRWGPWGKRTLCVKARAGIEFMGRIDSILQFAAEEQHAPTP